MRAVARRPRLLIFDEAFAGMDAPTVERCRSYIDAKLDDEQAVIFVTHYEEEVRWGILPNLAKPQLR